MIQANFGLNPKTKLGGWAHSLDAVSVVVEGTSAPVTVSLMQEMAAPDPVILLKFAEQLNLAQKNCRSMEEKVMYVRTSLASTSKAMADEAYAKDQWFVANNTDQQWLATRKDIGEAESLAKAVELFHADLTASEAAHQVLLKKHLANNEAGLARVDDLQEILTKLPEFVRLAAELAAYAKSLLDEVISLRTLEQTPRHTELALQAQLRQLEEERKEDARRFEQLLDLSTSEKKQLMLDNTSMLSTLNIMQAENGKLEKRDKELTGENLALLNKLANSERYLNLVGSVVFTAAQEGFDFKQAVLFGAMNVPATAPVVPSATKRQRRAIFPTNEPPSAATPGVPSALATQVPTTVIPENGKTSSSIHEPTTSSSSQPARLPRRSRSSSIWPVPRLRKAAMAVTASAAQRI
jgi:hypothetical protein